MKSMMKKTLSVIIALAMILVPMSVFAAAGDPVPVPSWEYCIYSGSTVTVGAGETIYFEIATEGSTDTLGFLVEGTGDFDVTVCTEDGAGAYLDGTPVSAIDGMVETTITGFESTYYYCAFAITNNSAEAVDYTCTIAFPQGSQSNPYPITLAVGGTATVTIPAYTEYYVGATLPEPMTEYQLTITGNTGFGVSEGWMPTWDTDGEIVTTTSAYYGPANICIVNNTEVEQTYTLALDNMPLGASSNPDTAVIGSQTATVSDNGSYHYTWTAVEDGTVTVSMDAESGWMYQVSVEPISGEWADYYTSDMHWYDDDPSVPSESIVVAAGDIVSIMVSTYDATGYYSPAGSVDWTLEFTTDLTGDEGGDDIGGGDIGGGDEGGEDVNYVESGESLFVGHNMCVVDGGYEYTIYTFEPTEEGVYTFTSDDSKMGIVSYNGLWITIDPSAETVNANEFVWECTGVGQSIWVAVKADTNIANITITREDRAPVVEVPWTIYENVVTPEDFTFEGNADELVYVDVEDETVDTAVLGEDGYYHLNSADGEILYVSLDDALVSMLAAQSYGQLIYVEQDENLVVLSKTDYNDAFAEYAACADEETMLYPLTVDLMEMLKSVGTHQGWYLENGYAGTSEDAWMFLCYYVPAAEDGGNQGGNEGGNVPDPEIPNTGAEAFGVAIAMMATAAALGATVVTTKKSKRVK